jgi:hypothetical protein
MWLLAWYICYIDQRSVLSLTCHMSLVCLQNNYVPGQTQVLSPHHFKIDKGNTHSGFTLTVAEFCVKGYKSHKVSKHQGIFGGQAGIEGNTGK